MQRTRAMLALDSGRNSSVSTSRRDSKNALVNKAQSLSLGLSQDVSTEFPNYSFDPRFYFPHFQPIVDIPSGRIVGYEGLVRTYSQEGDIVSAGWIFEDDHIDDDIRLNIDRSVRQKSLYRFAKMIDTSIYF